jgi:DNA replication protein DnaC
MEQNGLLDSYLRQLRLPTFLKNYRQFATDAAGNNLDHTRFLLALAEQEVNQREHNMIQRRVKAARFPVLKELADFDFSLVPTLNKSSDPGSDLVVSIIQKREINHFRRQPGLGKTHLATGISLAACRQKRKVRFWTAARLVNELLTGSR